MDINLTYITKFSSINVSNGCIYPNNYNVTLKLLTNTENTIDQNIAFDRLQFFIKEIVHNSIFINKNNKLFELLSTITPHKIIELPEEANDHTIGLALFTKLTSIMNEKLLILELDASGSDNDNLSYNIDIEHDFSEFSDCNWCYSEDLSTVDSFEFNRKLTWDDLDLLWDEDTPELSIECDLESNVNLDDIDKNNLNATIITGDNEN